MAYGTELPLVSTGVGFRSNFGPVTLAPGARVAAYVRSTGGASDDDPVISNNLVPTLAAGLARCRAGKNDVVFVLAGHTENVTGATMLDNLVAGTRVIGCGVGTNRPNFRWTATTAQWVLNDADCSFSNLILRLEGAVVVKGIVCTAAENAILGCDIDTGTVASTNLATIGIEIGAGATNFKLAGNYIHSVADSGSTNVVKVAGVCDGASIVGNKIMAATATAATIGVIDITAAATGLDIGDNLLQNRLASSQVGLSVTGAVACTGVVYDNFVATEAGTPVSDSFLVNAASLLRFFDNKGSDTKNTSGLLAPAVVT